MLPTLMGAAQFIAFLRMQAVFKVLIADQIPHLVQQDGPEMQRRPFVDVVKMEFHVLQIRHAFFTPI